MFKVFIGHSKKKKNAVKEPGQPQTDSACSDFRYVFFLRACASSQKSQKICKVEEYLVWCPAGAVGHSNDARTNSFLWARLL